MEESNRPAVSPLYPHVWTLWSNTTLRFALLAILVVGLTLEVYTAIPFEIFPALKQISDEAEQCVLSRLLPVLREVIRTSEPQVMSTFLHKCGAPWASHAIQWQLGGLGLLLAVAGIGYWLQPIWRIWARNLKPLTTESELTQEQSDAVASHLRALVAELPELDVHPVFLWDPLDESLNADTFGRRSHAYVILSGGWIQKFLQAEEMPRLRAVVKHELAHIENRDLAITGGMEALLRAFELTVLGPLGLGLFLTGSSIIRVGVVLAALAYVIRNPIVRPWVLGHWEWPIDIRTVIGLLGLGLLFTGASSVSVGASLVLTALVYVIYNAIWRSREWYADVRTAASAADREALKQWLEVQARPPIRAWSLLSEHPHPDDRLAVLEDPKPLLRIGFWEATGLGIAAALVAEKLLSNVLPPVVLVFSSQIVQILFSSPGQVMLFIGLVTVLFLSLIVMPIGAAGLGIWRMTLAAVVEGTGGDGTRGVERRGASESSQYILRRLPFVGPMLERRYARSERLRIAVAPIAFGLTVGLYSGVSLNVLPFYVELVELNEKVGRLELPSMSSLLGFELIWAALFVICAILFLRWVIAGASVWVEAVLMQEEGNGEALIRIRKRLRRVCLVGLCAGVGVLTFWVVPFLVVRAFTQAFFLIAPSFLQEMPFWVLPVSPSLLGGLIGYWGLPLLLFGLVSLWAFPLAVWWQRQEGQPLGSEVLPCASTSALRHSQRPLQPGLALFAGLIGGLIFWAFLPTIGVEVLRSVQDASAYVVVATLVVPAWALQVLVAAVVGSLTKRLAVIHGLLAAFITACIASGGLLAWHVISGRNATPPLVNLYLFHLMAYGGVLLALFAGWLGACLRTFTRARWSDPAWTGETPAGLPVALPSWNWGAFFLTWLWALRHKIYGVLLGYIPLLVLSLVIGIWGVTQMLPSILWWFVPLLVLSLVFPWFMPLLVLSLVVGIWGLDSLSPESLSQWLAMLVLGAVTTYALSIMMVVLGARGQAWGWLYKPWQNEAHFHRVQQRWSRWGVGGLVLGLGLVALVGFRDIPPAAPNRPILFQPVFQWTNAPETREGTGFFVQASQGTVVAVTNAHWLAGHQSVLRDIQAVDIHTQERITTFTSSLGRPGAGAIIKPGELDLSTDYLLMRVEDPSSSRFALELDARKSPLLGEPIWLPNRDATVPLGYQLVPGRVVTAHPTYLTVRLSHPILPEWQGGTPVISRLTGKVIGMLTGWERKEGEVLRVYLTPSWSIRHALATPHDLLPFSELPMP